MQQAYAEKKQRNYMDFCCVHYVPTHLFVKAYDERDEQLLTRVVYSDP